MCIFPMHHLTRPLNPECCLKAQLLVYSHILVRLLVWLAVCVGAETDEDLLLGYILLTNSEHEAWFVKLMLVHVRVTQQEKEHV